MENIKKIIIFVCYKLINMKNNDLIYYMFDWDDNILYMPTVIHLERLIDENWFPTNISTDEFSTLRYKINDYYEGISSEWRYLNDDYDTAFSEFRDFGKRGENAFLQDTKIAIKRNSFGPVWDDFIKCLVNGNLFAIITARGHEPNTIRKTIKWIINNILTKKEYNILIKNLNNFNRLFDGCFYDLEDDELIDEYINECYFIGISSKWFINKFNIDKKQSISSEILKLKAIDYFVDKVDNYGKRLGRNIKIGFSDDDIKNITSVYDYFKNKLSNEYPIIDFHTYHTFKEGKHKIII